MHDDFESKPQVCFGECSGETKKMIEITSHFNVFDAINIFNF